MKRKLFEQTHLSVTPDELLGHYGLSGQARDLETFISLHQGQLLNFLELQTTPSHAKLLIKAIWQSIVARAPLYQQQCSSKVWLYTTAKQALLRYHNAHNLCMSDSMTPKRTGQQTLVLAKAKFCEATFEQLYVCVYWRRMVAPAFLAATLSKLNKSTKCDYLLSNANLSLNDIAHIRQRPYQEVMHNIKSANYVFMRSMNLRIFEKMLKDNLHRINGQVRISTTLAAAIENNKEQLQRRSMLSTIIAGIAITLVGAGILWFM